MVADGEVAVSRTLARDGRDDWGTARGLVDERGCPGVPSNGRGANQSRHLGGLRVTWPGARRGPDVRAIARLAAGCNPAVAGFPAAPRFGRGQAGHRFVTSFVGTPLPVRTSQPGKLCAADEAMAIVEALLMQL